MSCDRGNYACAAKMAAQGCGQMPNETQQNFCALGVAGAYSMAATGGGDGTMIALQCTAQAEKTLPGDSNWDQRVGFENGCSLFGSQVNLWKK
jgi:hypothetical protein